MADAVGVISKSTAHGLKLSAVSSGAEGEFGGIAVCLWEIR